MAKFYKLANELLNLDFFQIAEILQELEEYNDETIDVINEKLKETR